MHNRIVLALFATVTLASVDCTLSADTGQVTHTVVIEGTRFEPQTLSVRRGETVVWINKDPFPHTATALNGGFDSKNIEPSKSWRYKAKKPGEFPYFCTLHPMMKATLRVR